jgi:hypothetical protein
LVADYGRCEGTFCGESYQSVLRQQSIGTRAERRRIRRHLSPERRPAGHESNWLPAPTGKFRLWLRAYMPSAAILDGTYTAPPVVEVK